MSSASERILCLYLLNRLEDIMKSIEIKKSMDKVGINESINQSGANKRSASRRCAALLSRVALLLAAVFVFFGAAPGGFVFADVSWVDPGIVGEKLVGGDYEYSEYTFVTGEPVILRGTVKRKEPESVLTAKGAFKISYDYQLSNDDGSITISRQVTFDVKPAKNAELGQIAVERTLSKFSETIVTPSGQYTLGKVNYLDSRIVDVVAVGGYTSGNAMLERTFYLNGDYKKNSGTLTITTDVRPIVAYENYYAKNESYVVVQKYSAKDAGGKELFGGSVSTGLSSLEKTIFDYQYTDPQNISFRGSFFMYKNQENVLESRYDFVQNGKRKGSTVRLSGIVATDSRALHIPNIRDMGGVSTERQVMLLTALEVLEPSATYFVPHSNISRHEFARALYIAIKGKLPDPTRTEVIKRLRPGVETPFLDVKPDDPDYHYITAYKEAGLVYGRNGYLKPDESITKAEAVTMVVRALGLDKVAPAPPYNTVFVDDAKIGEWAKDAHYMALEIGLIGGADTSGLVVRTADGLFANPGEMLSREQAAVLLERLINHLNETLIPDYREKIIKK